MSRFLGQSAGALNPYTPGEQPRDKRYIKLNTNECPYPPSPQVTAAINALDTADLRLYPDPEVKALSAAIASYYSLRPEQVFAGAGSDEVLAYCFMAFFDKGDKIYFPDITYGFYQVYAQLCGLNPVEIPLGEDYTLSIDDYMEVDGPILIANPNAPTGIALSPSQIEPLLAKDKDRLVMVDEAYVDFAKDKSCVPLLKKYDNLLIIQTFSKSRSLAGMRIGCGLGSGELMADLSRVKFSFNPYNLNRVSIAAGIAAIEDKAYFQRNVAKIVDTREKTAAKLTAMGFLVLPSETNFLFAAHPKWGGKELYLKLKEKGILVRQFQRPRIDGFVRVTVGTDGEMGQLLKTLEDLQ